MRKILYNTCYGGFGFSDELLAMFGIYKDEKLSHKAQYTQAGAAFCDNIDNRSKPEVIASVERMGLEAASGECCRLAIYEAEDDEIVEITSFDGRETVRFVCRARNGIVID
ncbi:hypothetical protein D3C72_1337050 [compost metagenome]